ncbi:hypothetical protein D3C80_907930 [compost metagenome]
MEIATRLSSELLTGTHTDVGVRVHSDICGCGQTELARGFHVNVLRSNTEVFTSGEVHVFCRKYVQSQPTVDVHVTVGVHLKPTVALVCRNVNSFVSVIQKDLVTRRRTEFHTGVTLTVIH